MELDVWPVVSREAIVSAYRRLPLADSEAPFRTLRKHDLVTAGKRLETREGRRLKGSVTLFSSLNVDAARLARHGFREQAATVARMAAEVEASPEWWLLLRMVAEGMASLETEREPASEPGNGQGLSSLNAHSLFVAYDLKTSRSPATQLLDAVFDGSQMPDPIAYVMRGIARQTHAARGLMADQMSVVGTATVGEVASLSEQVAVLRTSDGSEYAIPRAMAHSAHRDQLGALLALIFERVSDTVSVFEVTPAFDLELKVGDSAETVVRAMAKANPRGWPDHGFHPTFWSDAWRDSAASEWATWLASAVGHGTWPELHPDGPAEARADQRAVDGERAVDGPSEQQVANAQPGSTYSPFGRHDPRTVALTSGDVVLLAGSPLGSRKRHRGPRVLVPVRIEG